MNEEIKTVAISEFPERKSELLNYIKANWPPVVASAEKQLDKSFMMLKDNKIIGFYQLLDHEIIQHFEELTPWISCLFVDEKERGKRLGELMLIDGRKRAGNLGFEKVYLTTDHIQFYEKFGFKEIGIDCFLNGRPTKIYEAETMK